MEQAEEESATDDEVVQPVDLHEDQAAYLMGDHGEDSQLLSPTTASPKSVLSASDTDIPIAPKPTAGTGARMVLRRTWKEPEPQPKTRATSKADRKQDAAPPEEISDMSDDAKPSGKARR